MALPAAMLLSQAPARAILNINIFDDGPDLEVLMTGSLAELGALSGYDACGDVPGVLASSPLYLICTGPLAIQPGYLLSGPNGFGGTAHLFPADHVSGLTFGGLFSIPSAVVIDVAYIAGQAFLSGATFRNTSVAAQGFTASGLVGTWTIGGSSESINVYIGPPAAVPGPLPLFGAGAAFAWSRRLRRRIAAPMLTNPQA